MNDYYDVKLKFNRIKRLKKYNNFKYYKLDIVKKNLINKNFLYNKYNKVIHLAAQAGVRYSIEKPNILMLISLDFLIFWMKVVKLKLTISFMLQAVQYMVIIRTFS